MLRAFRGYTQGRVSDLTDLSRQYLSELEQGKRPRPRRETLERLATALGVTVPQLRGLEPIPGIGEATGGSPATPGPEAPPAPTGVPFSPSVTHVRLPDGSLLLHAPAPGAPPRPAGCPYFGTACGTAGGDRAGPAAPGGSSSRDYEY